MTADATTARRLRRKDWTVTSRRALTATEIVVQMARLDGWHLSGEGAALALEKAFAFVDYYETMAFVNAVALVAHVQDHHPTLLVHFDQCVVRFNTHDVQGISLSDIECAQQVDALLG